MSPLPNPFPPDAARSFLVRVAERDLACTRSLDEWAALSGTSVAELTRVLRLETGLSFRAWQRQVRLLGVTHLATGASVADAGRHAGYARTSAWVTGLRKAARSTPGNYFRPLVAPIRPASKVAEGRPRAAVSQSRPPREHDDVCALEAAFEATVVEAEDRGSAHVSVGSARCSRGSAPPRSLSPRSNASADRCLARRPQHRVDAARVGREARHEPPNAGPRL